MQTKRQKQLSKLVQQALSDIFLKEGQEILKGAMVTVTQAEVAADLSVAKAYLSIYNSEEPDAIMDNIQASNKQLRYLMGTKLRHQMRRMPELIFFRDNTLDEVFKLEEIFRDLEKKEKDEPKED